MAPDWVVYFAVVLGSVACAGIAGTFVGIALGRIKA